ncbi:unnamed protein product [Microthlaspi erraticum]|uniref:Uncharacterized protein n=1 Tax=Microthlaspi erraticum TaxID=1685480 RepID=A0A6D2JLV4_9BRAS|nr:unnamed protein product [Microthlaspi erraticum]
MVSSSMDEFPSTADISSIVRSKSHRRRSNGVIINRRASFYRQYHFRRRANSIVRSKSHRRRSNGVTINRRSLTVEIEIPFRVFGSVEESSRGIYSRRRLVDGCSGLTSQRWFIEETESEGIYPTAVNAPVGSW